MARQRLLLLLFLLCLSAVHGQMALPQDQVAATVAPAPSDVGSVSVLPESEIVISAPAAGEVYKVDMVEVRGTFRSAGEVERLLLTVNWEREFPVEGVESWSSTVTLSKGANHIIAMAIDPSGNILAKAEVTVYYVPPEVIASIAEKPLPTILERETVKKRIVASRLADIARRERGRYLIDRRVAPLERAAIEIKLRQMAEEASLANDVVVEEYTEVPSDMAVEEKSAAGLSPDEELLGSFVRIESNLTGIDWAIVKIEFSEEELKAKRLAGERLFMVWYDENVDSPTFGRWVRLRRGSPEWVHDVGVNRTGRYVWANVSHFSVYGIAGQIETATPTPPPTTAPPTETPAPTTAPPTETPAPTGSLPPPEAVYGGGGGIAQETLPPTHFPKETPKPTVGAQPTESPSPVMTTSAPAKAFSGGRRTVRRRKALVAALLILAIAAAALLLIGRRGGGPLDSAEKDLLADEETPSDDNPDN
ncbi:MAG: hypothetical protein D6733_01830 [Methanobacteriota archaeon]|nr:MAG: hypothetical protein D6733_01830 [Euryarchaeota archaeon]